MSDPMNPYETPSAPMQPMEPAPGAKTASTCGILGLVLAIPCFPIGIVLAIVALVQHSKAKKAEAAEPRRYLPVPSTGFVTAIIALIIAPILAIIGIISAIAIPAMLGQRQRAQERMVQSQVMILKSEIYQEAERIHMDKGRKATPDEVIDVVLAAKVAERNPYARESGRSPFIRAERPEALGEIALSGRASWFDPKLGWEVPAVVIRWKVRNSGGEDEREEIVSLD